MDMSGFDRDKKPSGCHKQTAKLAYALREPQGWRKVHWQRAKSLHDFFGGAECAE